MPSKFDEGPALSKTAIRSRTEKVKVHGKKTYHHPLQRSSLACQFCSHCRFLSLPESPRRCLQRQLLADHDCFPWNHFHLDHCYCYCFSSVQGRPQFSEVSRDSPISKQPDHLHRLDCCCISFHHFWHLTDVALFPQKLPCCLSEPWHYRAGHEIMEHNYERRVVPFCTTYPHLVVQIPPNDRSEHVLPVSDFGAIGTKADADSADNTASKTCSEFNRCMILRQMFFFLAMGPVFSRQLSLSRRFQP